MVLGLHESFLEALFVVHLLGEGEGFGIQLVDQIDRLLVVDLTRIFS